ncbi:hypothetical protein CEXT_516101 [Caerostris extrusa]|uniref:Uncharacterized protein n=1 Tax=Caerostris extrusa TaxID=172846 RepID=A0AAV4NM07_CAEEX|nr:hypothetical protein CEXT_516101 [Caerostris extrusa]
MEVTTFDPSGHVLFVPCRSFNLLAAVSTNGTRRRRHRCSLAQELPTPTANVIKRVGGIEKFRGLWRVVCERVSRGGLSGTCDGLEFSSLPFSFDLVKGTVDMTVENPQLRVLVLMSLV